MELEQSLGNTSWEILKALSTGEKTPAELASLTGISLASISQQTKLLHAYGIISLQKRAHAGPGKPKTLYALARELAHVAVVRRGFAAKKTVRLDDYRKARLNLLLLERSEEQYFLDKFLWEREEFLVHCDALALCDSNGRELHLLVLTDDAHLEKVRKEMSQTTVKHVLDKKEDRKIICWTHTHAEVRDGLARHEEYFVKLLASPHVLIDKKNILGEFTK